MKFIFPKNYQYRMKLLGILDYKTGIVDLFVGIILYFGISFFIKNIELKIYVLIILYFPIILFSIFGIGNENIISVLRFLLKYLFKPKVYLYKSIKKKFGVPKGN